MKDYGDFLKGKAIKDKPTGMADVPELNPMLFDFQRDIVRWALRRGRAAIFADCGTGKTPMQLEWARRVAEHTGGRVIIFAPLAVAHQTIREGVKFGVHVEYCRDGGTMPNSQVIITNYEMMHHFNAAEFSGVVLDESSILKSHTGKYRTELVESFGTVPFRLACTATPAPNDFMELGNHAEFIGAMTRTEMLSMFFVHDGGDTSKWRLKGHAETEFWKWLCSWAVMIRKPSDLGYDNGKFTLPALRMHEHVVRGSIIPGDLIPMQASTLSERQSARRSTIEQRCRVVADMVNASDEPWLVWCDLNAESAMLASMIPDAVEVTGNDSQSVKESRIDAFSDGTARVLVSKPSICGFGMNWQHCANMAFTGLSDSYEKFYQAVRRCWRFGQDREVHAHIVTAETEGAVVANIQRKEEDAEKMAESMVEHMADISSEEIRGIKRDKSEYVEGVESGESWTAYRGDCVEQVSRLKSDSVGFSVFSPPFASLYTYSNSDRDMGNCTDDDDFMTHFGFLIKELYRVTKPGRLCSFHCTNYAAMKERHGYIGIRDFRGALIRAFEDAGWIYHSEVCIWKDPVTAMQRTKALGLLHKQIKKDSCMSRQGIPDYLVTMRKPGDNAEPVTGDFMDKYESAGMDGREIARRLNAMNGASLSINMWQLYASPVWMDINPSNTLQKESARDHKDERHICPLQLDVIERAVIMWSNPGDLLLSPFMGIGSEGVVSLRMKRRFVGVELKESYYRQAVNNLEDAERAGSEQDLFAMAEAVNDNG